MIHIDIKPMSVNDAWKGRRFRTDEYKRYQNSLLWLLPKIKLPPPPYELHFKFGFSSSASDWDNPIKPTQDILSKKYGFNDKLIRKATVETEIVPKGKEYIEFEIKTLKNV
jgi:Endodeoxyribonuclease RusA.